MAHTKIAFLLCFLLLIFKSSCGLESYETGRFKLSWFSRGNFVDFNFTVNIPETENIWAAFAFSTDKLMGDDDVSLCMINGSDRAIEHHHNYGKAKPSLLLPNDSSVGFSNITVSLVEGLLTCSFIRQVKMSEVKDYYDLNKEHYLLFAYGSIYDNTVQYHTERDMNTKKIKFAISTRTDRKLDSETFIDVLKNKTNEKVVISNLTVSDEIRNKTDREVNVKSLELDSNSTLTEVVKIEKEVTKQVPVLNSTRKNLGRVSKVLSSKEFSQTNQTRPSRSQFLASLINK